MVCPYFIPEEPRIHREQEFFRSLLSDNGRTKFLVARSYAFDEKMFNRVKVVADAHLSLRAEKMGGKTVKTMEVRKINNVELRSGNEVSFEVAQGAGMRVIPGGKIKV